MRMGELNWKIIHEALINRTSISYRIRCKKCLKQNDGNREWNLEEEFLEIRVEKLGINWVMILHYFSDKIDNDVKNLFHLAQRKKNTNNISMIHFSDLSDDKSKINNMHGADIESHEIYYLENQLAFQIDEGEKFWGNFI
jgi:hypothetical protein